jgi:hypothetical protein
MMIYKMIPDGRRQITGFLFEGDLLGLVDEGKYAVFAFPIPHSKCGTVDTTLSKNGAQAWGDHQTRTG